MILTVFFSYKFPGELPIPEIEALPEELLDFLGG